MVRISLSFVFLLICTDLYVCGKGGLSKWQNIGEIMNAEKLLQISATEFVIVARVKKGGHLLVGKTDENGNMIANATFASNHGLVFKLASLSPNGGLFLGWETPNPTEDSYEPAGIRIIRLSDNLSTLWERTYPDLTLQHSPNPEIVYFAPNRTYSLLAERKYRVLLLEVAPESGELISETVVDSNFYYSTPPQSYITARTPEDTLAFSISVGDTTKLFVISNSTRLELLLSPLSLISLVQTRDRGFVGVGNCDLQPGATKIVFVKLDRNGTVVLEIRSAKVSFSFVSFIENSLGQYVEIGTISKDLSTRGYMVGLFPNGTKRWHKTFGLFVNLQRIYEVTHPNYLLLGFHSLRGSVVESWTLPEPTEELRCADLSDCALCPMGSYWNLSGCLPCPRGCAACHNPGFCLSCTARFRLIEGKRCVATRGNGTHIPAKCNCSEGNIVPVCAKRCAPTECEVRTDDEVPKVVSSSSNNTACTCPTLTTVDNGTHCLRIVTSSCPSLCSHCVHTGNFAYCTSCAVAPKVVVHRTGRTFVDCLCQAGLLFNGTVCSSSDVTTPADVKEKERNGGRFVSVGIGVVLGVVVVAFAVVACVVGRRRSGRICNEVSVVTQNTEMHGPEREIGPGNNTSVVATTIIA